MTDAGAIGIAHTGLPGSPTLHGLLGDTDMFTDIHRYSCMFTHCIPPSRSAADRNQSHTYQVRPYRTRYLDIVFRPPPAAHHSNEHMPVLLVIALGFLAPVARASFTLLDPSDYRPHFGRLPEVGGITGIVAAEWADEWLLFIDLPETGEPRGVLLLDEGEDATERLKAKTVDFPHMLSSKHQTQSPTHPTVAIPGAPPASNHEKGESCISCVAPSSCPSSE